MVLVAGTGTEVGKTWVGVELIGRWRAAGHRVVARKLSQSFEPGDPPEGTDAALLAAASGEEAERVCPRWRWYPLAMAPPMAAEALGRPPFTIPQLLAELTWSGEVGLLETAGGVRSPQAADGDVVDLAATVQPDATVLVGDAGLGTINAVRLSVEALADAVPVSAVVLNRFDPADRLHQANLRWLSERYGLPVVPVPAGVAELARLLVGSAASPGRRD